MPPNKKAKLGEDPPPEKKTSVPTKSSIPQTLNTSIDKSVDHLLYNQVNKVAGLLRDIKNDLTLRVATVCSGTESPVLALQLIQEQAKKHGVEINVEHVHSCENAPFKACYIRRNFPNVPVFRDVVQLGNAAESNSKGITMLGCQMDVPDADVLVAGTSCKDFSTLKTAALDELGSSANTFFATVKMIHAKKYSMVLLENVMRAEWDAMASYITGRLSVEQKKRPAAKKTDDGEESESTEEQDEEDNSDVEEGAKQRKRTSKSKPAKKKKVDDVVFELQSGGDDLYVYSTPSWAGVRANSMLKGYSVGGAGEHPNCKVHQINVSKLAMQVGDTITMSDLLSKLDIDRVGTHLIFDTPVQYSHHLISVDTKNFGLPQTRQRRYMLLWRADKYKFNEAGKMWQELVKNLEVPSSCTYDDFLLPESDPAVRRFRDALRGPMGKRQSFLRQRGYWWTSTSKDVKKHKEFRSALVQCQSAGVRLAHPMEELARPCTSWGPNGKLCLASHKWMPESVQMFYQREVDLLDCAIAKNAQSGNDFFFHATSIDTSQNVNRTVLVPCNPGVVGCITPGGNIFLTHRGRPILGREKLLLSGIPTDRLLLGPESEVELSDLAGNAMSCPVVGACLLSMLCLQAYHAACSQQSASSAQKRLTVLKAAKRAEPVKEIVGDECENIAVKPTLNNIDWVARLKALGSDAFSTSVLCTCETSGGVSTHNIMGCKDCNLFVCSKCAVLVQTQSHSLSVVLKPANRTITPSSFETKLWETAPQVIVIEQDEQPRVDLNIVGIQRERGDWEINYESRNDSKTFVCVRVGNNGVSALARLSGVNQYELHHDSTTWTRRTAGNKLENVLFEALDSDYKRTSTHAVECGMDPKAAAAKDSWPGAIKIQGELKKALAGVYVRQACRNTFPFGVLYRNESSGYELFISTEVSRQQNKLQLRDVQTNEYWKVANGNVHCDPLQLLSSLKGPSSQTFNLISTNNISTTSNIKTFCVAEGKSKAKTSIEGLTCIVSNVDTKYMVSNTKMVNFGDKKKVSFRLKYGRTVLTQRSMNVLVGPMNSVSVAFSSDWTCGAELDSRASLANSWGEDEKITCPAPPEVWSLNCKPHKRIVDPDAAIDHERKLATQCKPWKISATIGHSEDVVVAVRPMESLHRAAFMLRFKGLGRVVPSNVKVEWRVLTSQSNFIKCMEEKTLAGFQVGSEVASQESDEFDAPDWVASVLYIRQKRMLRWMMRVEAGDIHYTQSEFLSDCFFSTIPWTLQAKASCKTALRGGMVCDSMGGGKTVIVIGLVATEKQSRTPEHLEKRCHNESRATLVLAPKLTVKATWAKLAQQFDPDLNVVTIETASDLQETRTSKLLNADLVVVSQDILLPKKEDKGDDYSQLLTRFAGQSQDLPPLLHGKNRSRRTGLVGDAIIGVYIPHVAQSPYGSSETRQLDREVAAYYSYQYAAAIKASRQKVSELGDEVGSTKGVPLEAISWNRLVVDEIQNGFDSGSASEESEKTQAAIRELIGVGVNDPDKRPLQTRGCVWGLSGTPIFNQHRTVEYASICSGVNVAGGATHWRLLERASTRDATLYAMRQVPEPCDVVEQMEACQSYLNLGTQCLYQYDEKLEGVELNVQVRMAKAEDNTTSKYLKALAENDFEHSSTPSPYDLPETALKEVLEGSASDSARAHALKRCVRQVEKARGDAPEKLIVVTPLYAYPAARKALENIGQAFVDSKTDTTDAIAAFASNEKAANAETTPWILLLDEQNITGLNLQHVSRFMCFFAPIFKNVSAEAAAVERQAIGRIYRPGQLSGNVHVVHIILTVDDTGKTFDEQIHEQNTSKESVSAATGV